MNGIQAARLSGRCLLCGCTYIDAAHIVPRGHCSDDSVENVIALCRHCHNLLDGREGDMRTEMLDRVLDPERESVLRYRHPTWRRWVKLDEWRAQCSG